MIWTFLILLGFSVFLLFRILPLPTILYINTAISYPPWILNLTLGTIILAIGMVSAFFWGRPLILSRLMVVAVVFYVGYFVTHVVGDLMPEPNIENVEDDMSEFSNGMALIAFNFICFVTALVGIVVLDFAGRWMQILQLQDKIFWRTRFKYNGIVSLFSKVAALLVFTITDSWQIRS